MRRLMPGLVILSTLTVLALLAVSPSSRAQDVSSGTTTQTDGTGPNVQTDGTSTNATADGTGEKPTVTQGSTGQKFPNETNPTDGLNTDEAKQKGGCCG